MKLTVTDDESLTATHSEDVTVGNRNPSADFNYSPAAPEVGETVTFTSDATDPENRIDVQRWDLDGDSNYEATGASATKKFMAGGPHTVTLLVEDQDGGSDTISKTVDVIDPPNQDPTPAFNFSPTDPMVLDNVIFTSTSSDDDGSIQSTQWDFDDNGIFDASGPQVSHMYLFAQLLHGAAARHGQRGRRQGPHQDGQRRARLRTIRRRPTSRSARHRRRRSRT